MLRRIRNFKFKKKFNTFFETSDLFRIALWVWVAECLGLAFRCVELRPSIVVSYFLR